LVEAAGLLGVAASTLRQRALTGKISHARDGRRWVFSWSDIAQYLESRWVPSYESGATEAQEKAHQCPHPLHADDTITAEAHALGLL
jgi:excisionase family DNA binding protein